MHMRDFISNRNRAYVRVYERIYLRASLKVFLVWSSIRLYMARSEALSCCTVSNLAFSARHSSSNNSILKYIKIGSDR